MSKPSAMRENLTEAWEVRWTGATTATLEAAGIHGATLVQAGEAAVRRLRQSETADSDADTAEHQHPATTLARLFASAECGLGDSVKKLLTQLDGPFLHAASAAQLIEAAVVIERIAVGHFVGLPLREDDAAPPDVDLFEAPAELLDAEPLLNAALRGLDGLRGSDDPADVVALVDLTAMVRGDLRRSSERNYGELRRLFPLYAPVWCECNEKARRECRERLGGHWRCSRSSRSIELAAMLGSWYDGAVATEGRGQLRSRLARPPGSALAARFIGHGLAQRPREPVRQLSG